VPLSDGSLHSDASNLFPTGMLRLRSRCCGAAAPGNGGWRPTSRLRATGFVRRLFSDRPRQVPSPVRPSRPISNWHKLRRQPAMVICPPGRRAASPGGEIWAQPRCCVAAGVQVGRQPRNGELHCCSNPQAAPVLYRPPPLSRAWPFCPPDPGWAGSQAGHWP